MNLPPLPEEDEDEDVKKERERISTCINQSVEHDDILLVHELVKKYEAKAKKKT